MQLLQELGNSEGITTNGGGSGDDSYLTSFNPERNNPNFINLGPKARAASTSSTQTMLARTVTFEDPVTLYVEGNLDILGGKLDFQQGGTIYVSDDVNIKSDGVKRATITGATGPNDWIVFYGGGDLKIGEALPSGQPPVIGDEIPNVVFLMTTHEPGTDNRRLPQVSIYESRIAGGIFNPHGVINAFTGFDLVGSVVKGRYFNVGMEDPYWEDNYKAHEARMKSFSIDGHGVVQPGSVGGLEYVGWREVTS